MLYPLSYGGLLVVRRRDFCDVENITSSWARSVQGFQQQVADTEVGKGRTGGGGRP